MGLIQTMLVPMWKGEHIFMDFVVVLSKTLENYDSIYVIVDWLTKSVHLLSIKVDYSS